MIQLRSVLFLRKQGFVGRETVSRGLHPTLAVSCATRLEPTILYSLPNSMQFPHTSSIQQDEYLGYLSLLPC